MIGLAIALAAALLGAAGLVATCRASELALRLVGCGEVRCAEPRAAAVCAGFASPSEAAEPSGGERPTLLLAQRVIERSWGPSEDTVYVVHEIPDWREEGIALGLSAAIPGLGQAYAGETRRGLLFAAAEAAGWIVRQIHAERGDDLRDQAASFAGVPTDSGSAWTFDRFERAGGDDPELRELYAADRDAFYDRIASEPRYATGWGGDAGEQQRHLASLREVSDDRLRLARYVSMGLWINHLAAAVDALRAARLHNLPLLPQLGIKVKSGWRAGGPAISARIERRF